MADDHNRVYQKLREIEPDNQVLTNLAFGLYESARGEFIQEKDIKNNPDGQDRLRQWTEDWTEQRFSDLIEKSSRLLNDFSYAFLNEHIKEILKNQTSFWKMLGLNVLSSFLATVILPIIIVVAVLHLSVQEFSFSDLFDLLKNIKLPLKKDS